GDHGQEGHDEGLDPAKTKVLHPQDQKYVERRDQHADLERDAEQQVEADGGSDDLGEVGRADRDFSQHPERPSHRAGKGATTGLGKIGAGREAEARTKRLKQNRHEIGQQRDDQQRVAELGSASERSGPVAGIHIAYGNEVARTQKGENLPPHRAGWSSFYGAEYLRQGGPRPLSLPAWLRPWRVSRHMRSRGYEHRSPPPMPHDVLVANNLQ